MWCLRLRAVQEFLLGRRGAVCLWVECTEYSRFFTVVSVRDSMIPLTGLVNNLSGIQTGSSLLEEVYRQWDDVG